MLLDLMFERRSLENPNVPLTGQNLQEYLHGDGRGAQVTPTAGWRLAAVYSCIYVLASSIAQLPVAVLRKQGNRIEPGSDHPAHYLLHDAPNDWQTSYKWRETMMGHVLGWGNGYSRLLRSRRGELLAIDRLLPQETTLVKIGGRWVYASLSDGGTAIAIPPEDMLHIRALGRDGRIGISPIMQNAEAIGLGLAAQRYGKQFFDGGGQPTGVLTVKGELGKDAWERLKEFWKKAVARLRSEDNKTLLLPADLDFKKLTIEPEAAQFIESRKLSRSEIAGLFNVPAHMINDLDKATFSNISEQAIQFVRHTIMPWVQNWEQELNRRIFTRFEREAGYYIKFNLGGLLRGTAKERAEFYHYAITDGWMTRNEVRLFEDMNPVDGLDEMLISVNARPISQQQALPGPTDPQNQ
ncbi:phage portal protein [Paracandidimonas soli]|uniref:HK97 family phage portal protein n=1 Tax=Paracandidimonas soli TaxID=1917182 RepID=A0A4V2VQB1_9BURK|nr:phage portal protein [Paracandidimonas soli]TCU93939.1 HK97 family phage portal protein [Paracandidimonas soli]